MKVVFHDYPGPFHAHFPGPSMTIMSIFYVFPVPWTSNKSYTHAHLLYVTICFKWQL